MLSQRLFSAKKARKSQFYSQHTLQFQCQDECVLFTVLSFPCKIFFTISICYLLPCLLLSGHGLRSLVLSCKYAKLLWCRDDVQLGDTIMDNTIISINYCVAFQYIIKQFTVNIPYLWSMLHLEYSIMLIFSQVIKVNRSFKFLMQHPPSTI